MVVAVALLARSGHVWAAGCGLVDGLACTCAALLGYGLMTLGPVEHAHLTVATVRSFFISERAVLLGGIVTGPLLGWFGRQWRTRRAIAGAPLVTAAVLCPEPFARGAVARPIDDRSVWLAEVSAGLALAAAVPAGRFGRTAQD